ncbi:MAG TPA: glycine cleavage system protein GcvH [Geobacterales bacterium]|nr:glycine cleavage system protein GcvH [Geobacterales bacterium]
MELSEELKYSKEHLWVRLDGDLAVIGITDFAQEELGAIRGVELPSVGDEVEQDDSFGSLEARKTVAELYAPVSGEVVEVNDELTSTPELLNDDPYDGGWLIMIRLNDRDELTSLMSVDDYVEHVESIE